MFVVTFDDIYYLIGAATCAGSLVVIGGGSFGVAVLLTARWIVRQKKGKDLL